MGTMIILFCLQGKGNCPRSDSPGRGGPDTGHINGTPSGWVLTSEKLPCVPCLTLSHQKPEVGLFIQKNLPGHSSTINSWSVLGGEGFGTFFWKVKVMKIITSDLPFNQMCIVIKTTCSLKQTKIEWNVTFSEKNGNLTYSYKTEWWY